MEPRPGELLEVCYGVFAFGLPGGWLRARDMVVFLEWRPRCAHVLCRFGEVDVSNYDAQHSLKRVTAGASCDTVYI